MVDVDRVVNSSVQEGKVLSCMFHDDVLCSYRKTESFGIMDRCLKCVHYLRFLRVMGEKDEKEMDEIWEMERLHVAYKRGEITEEELRKRFFGYMHGELE